MTVRIKILHDREGLIMMLVKAAVLLIVLSFLLTPLSRGRNSEARGPRGPETILPARILAAGTYTVPVEVAARVVAIRVMVGDQVRAGQLLANLDSPELRAERDRAALRLKVAAQALELTRSGKGNARSQLLQEQYRAAQGVREAASRRLLDYSLSPYEQAVARAKANLERVRQLAERHLATDVEIDAAQRQEQGEISNLAAAKDQRQRLVEESDAALSRVRQAGIQIQTATGGAEAELARLNFEEARSNLRALEDRQALLVIKAPAAGRVVQVNAAEGLRLGAGSALMVIADLSKLNFDVPATTKIAQSLRTGDEVEVVVPLDPPAHRRAQISQILLTPEQQQPYTIRVTIPNPAPDQILAGLEGAVRFSHDRRGGTGNLRAAR